MKSDFLYWMTIPTRWRDMDAMGHVNSAIYFTYFEIIRMAYFYDIGLHRLKVPGKVGPAVVSQSCNYRQQIFHPAEIDAGIRSTEIGTKSFSVEYEFYLRESETLMCDGKTVMVWVDYEAAKAIAIPDELRAGISAVESREF